MLFQVFSKILDAAPCFNPQCLIIQPFLCYSQSLIVVEHYFPQYAIVGQDLLGSKASVDKVLSLLPEDILYVRVFVYFTSIHFWSETRQIHSGAVSLTLDEHVRKELLNTYQAEKNPMKRWEQLKSAVHQKRVQQGGKRPIAFVYFIRKWKKTVPDRLHC